MGVVVFAPVAGDGLVAGCCVVEPLQAVVMSIRPRIRAGKTFPFIICSSKSCHGKCRIRTSTSIAFYHPQIKYQLWRYYTCLTSSGEHKIAPLMCFFGGSLLVSG